MIVFLTLVYVAVLALLLKLRLIRLNLWWKISPLVWMVVLLVVLFIPMQWGAPTGTVQVYQYFVEVIPEVSGKVAEVPVKPLTPIAGMHGSFGLGARYYILDRLSVKGAYRLRVTRISAWDPLLAVSDVFALSMTYGL